MLKHIFLTCPLSNTKLIGKTFLTESEKEGVSSFTLRLREHLRTLYFPNYHLQHWERRFPRILFWPQPLDQAELLRHPWEDFSGHSVMPERKI